MAFSEIVLPRTHQFDSHVPLQFPAIGNYFASFNGHAWLWQGRGSKAAQALIAFANHAAPTFVWREEQGLRDEPFRKVGDMPHNWASAEPVMKLSRPGRAEVARGWVSLQAHCGRTTE